MNEARAREGVLLASLDAELMASALRTIRHHVVTMPDGKGWPEDIYKNIRITPDPTGAMLLLSYSDKAQHEGRWTAFERLCRGLVLRRDGTIMARPWPKFFNWGELLPAEQDRLANMEVRSVSSKEDGSLAVIFHDGASWRVATRGSFTSPQALWAERHLHNGKYNLHILRPDHTYLAEIITPLNRVVMDYGQREELVLLGIVQNSTGVALRMGRVWGTAQLLNMICVPHTDLANLTEIGASLKTTQGVEGWVATFNDGTMVKFKTDWYLELHRTLSGFNAERVREALLAGESVKYRERLSEELRPDFDRWLGEIGQRWHNELAVIMGVYQAATQATALGDGTRKTFAAIVNSMVASHARWAMFMLFDGKSISLKVLKGLDLSDLGGGGKWDTWKGGDEDG